MGQLVLFFALQLLGSWACLAVGPRDEVLSMAMGLVVGLAIAVFLSLPLLLLGCFTVAAVATALGVSLLATVGLAIRRGRVTRATALRTLVWALAVTAVCIPFCVWNVAAMTYDSRVFVEYAQALRDDHVLRLETLSYLHSWGSFQIVAHALSLLTGDPFLYALAPAFSISLVATFAVTLHRGLAELVVPSRCRVIVVALVVAGMLAIPLVRLHVVYVHANWTAAGYLFVFAALFWLADIKQDPGYLPVAFLSLLAFCFARVESAMFAAPFLLVTVTQTRLVRSAVMVSYLPFTVVLTTWLVLMTSVIPSDSDYLTPSRSMLMVAAELAIFAMFLIRDTGWMQRLRPRLPPLAGILCVVGIAAIAVMRFDVFRTSFVIWQHDLWTGSFWGYFAWPLFSVLAVLAFRVAVPPESRPLRYGIALFFALVILLTCLGDDYGAGRYGSLTRVTLHIVPLIWFYFALTFGPAACKAGLRTDAPSEP